jgi:glyoxylase-like metal-dependent hydrolase (beta-lactamase superfamily II)/8-oxo-dGTP pyrophosphatase MutT (NUDIX family)
VIQAPPLRPAASVILVTRDPKLRVLWVLRAEANPFLGGFHSFPGGRLSREDGGTDTDEALVRSMMRCAVRETFEETGVFVGLTGTPPPLEAQRLLREQVLNGNAEFWASIERLGMALDPDPLEAAGRWVTPPFARARFDTIFFLAEVDRALPADVWPGELESGGWIEPGEALEMWDRDEVTLAMPTLHVFQVLAAEEGRPPSTGLARRLSAVPEANRVPSRHVIIHPGIVMVPLRTETLLPATHTNAVVVGDREMAIIDPGTAVPEDLAPLYEVVDGVIARGGRVKTILLTHRHKDHLMGADGARLKYGAPVWGHPSIADRVKLDRELREGDKLELDGAHPRRLVTYATPGHSSSHFAFLEETSRTLISGDLVSTLGTVIINPPDGNMADYMRSVERIRELGATALVPGHGPPSRGVEPLLAQLLAHRHEREAKVLRALAGGPLTEDALREEVYKDTPGAAATLAARTLEAHLIKLIEEGRVLREGESISLT